MNQRIQATTLIAALLLGPLACSTEDSVGGTGASLVDYAAFWDGYAEAYKFDGKSDRVRVKLDANGGGTIELGDRPLYPPPTNFDVGYPPVSPDDRLPMWSALERFQPGFLYQIHGARVEARRLRFLVNVTAPFESWCQHQTPFLYNDNADQETYLCIPSGSYSSADGGATCWQPTSSGEIPLDCGKYELCASFEGLCTCVATGCMVNNVFPRDPVVVDAALEDAGNKLVGTMLAGPRLTIRLTRQ